MIELIYVLVGVIALVAIIAWLMMRDRNVLELEDRIRRPREIVVLREELEPKEVLLTREIQEARQPNGVFVVMKTELIEQLSLLASRRRLSRSALCRELIMRGLESLSNERA